jgi:RsiW-degrading membrane proteinase PrsW (M82 family)
MGGSFEPFGLVTALTLLVVGLSGIPLAVISLRRLNNPLSDPPRLPSRRWFYLLVLFPVVILIGHLVFRSSNFNAALGAIAQLSAAAIPAILMIFIARRNGPPLSGRRIWALYLGGAWLAPLLSLIAEGLLIIPVGLFLLGQSNDLPQLQQLIEQIRQGSAVGLSDRQTIDLISQPTIWVPVLLFVSLIVPLIEEAFKSIAIWPLLPRRLDPGEAFIGGVICGAGYAFVEALLLAAPDPQWSLTMVARVGATMMHSFTTGLVAWGLVKAWNEKKVGTIMRAYGGAVFFHGLWNATTLAIVGFGVKSMTEPASSEGILLAGALVGLLLLFGLAIGALIGIHTLSKRFNPPRADLESAENQLSG